MSEAPLSPAQLEAALTLGIDPALYERRSLEPFGEPFRLPYHLGLYLAVNAIPGCYLIVDGPDCIYRKAEWIHGKHDLCSTLLDACGRHRVVSTLMHSDEVIKSTGDAVVKRLRRLALLDEVELVLVNTMPHVQIIGTQYDALIATVEHELTAPIYEVPSQALERDWIDGYAATLETLASRLPINPGGLIEDEVAIVGLLMERVEADATANVAELERLVAGLGLRPCSTWLSNRPLAHLQAATRASTLLALPHGVDAARRLARRTGARVVEVGQPFGFRSTLAMLRALAAATGREQQAEALIDAELRQLVPRLEWTASSLLLGRRLAFAGDPTLFEGLLEGAAELGVEVLYLGASARQPSYGAELDPARLGPHPPPVYAPSIPELSRQLNDLRRSHGLDLVVGGSRLPNTRNPSNDGPARVHFGFPNFFCHALFDSPYLGFRGWIWFVQQLVNACIARPRAQRGAASQWALNPPGEPAQ